MANALLERETLDADEIKLLLAGKKLEPLHSRPRPVPPPDKEPVPKPEVGRKEFPGTIPPLADPDPSA
jgi:hypothetical protein